MVYLFCNEKKLEATGPIKDRIGAAYKSLNIRKDGNSPVLVFLLSSFARRIALGFVVTLGRTSPLAQLLFMNYSSLALIAVIATVKPFAVRSQNVVELANEFSILILFYHCNAQTEFVQDPAGRWAAGWSLNGLVILSVVGNLCYILKGESVAIYRKLWLLYQKKLM